MQTMDYTHLVNYFGRMKKFSEGQLALVKKQKISSVKSIDYIRLEEGKTLRSSYM